MRCPSWESRRDVRRTITFRAFSSEPSVISLDGLLWKHGKEVAFMAEQKSKIDRRTLLKMVGSAGATGVVFSSCGWSPQTASAHSGAGLTGGKWEKTIPLATAGPGGNPNWQPGDAIKFLPSEKIPTSGRASDLLANLPK